MPHLTTQQCRNLAAEAVEVYRDYHAQGLPPAEAQARAVALVMEGVEQLAGEQGEGPQGAR